jgi:hypothetical protein
VRHLDGERSRRHEGGAFLDAGRELPAEGLDLLGAVRSLPFVIPVVANALKHGARMVPLGIRANGAVPCEIVPRDANRQMLE